MRFIPSQNCWDVEGTRCVVHNKEFMKEKKNNGCEFCLYYKVKNHPYKLSSDQED